MDLDISGYLVKKADSDRPSGILMMVAQGREAVESQLLESLFAWDDIATVGDMFGLIDPLTGHQLCVLATIGTGLTNADIATLLPISENTVRTHVRHIYKKLNVSDRANAVIWAFNNGLGPVIRTRSD